MRWVLLLACVAACGRLDFDSSGGSGSGDGGIDAPEPTTGPWQQVSSRDSAVCAIKPSGEAWCWGYNIYSNTTAPGALWALPTLLPGAWAEIAAGSDHTCGIHTDRTLWCWGYNGTGALGDGTTVDHQLPNQVGTANNWLRVRGTNSVTCALDMTNTLSCWGNNKTTTNVYSPLAAPSFSSPQVVDATVVDFDVSYDHVCSIHADGTMHCIGNNNFGDIGNGTAGMDNTNWAQVGAATDWYRLATSETHTCALKHDGTLWCWGNGGEGRTGMGDETERNAPVQVGNRTGWTSVEAGISHTCAAAADGSLWCFGTSSHGEIGPEIDSVLVPTQVTPLAILGYAAGRDVTCFVTTGGVLHCGGNRDHGELAVPGAPTTPVRADARTDWTQLSMRNNTTCAIDTAGMGWCWGEGSSTQIGNGSYLDEQHPVQLPGTGWTVVAAGERFSAGIAGGKLYEWGHNIATGNNDLTPVVIDGSTDWSAVTVGQQHACGLRTTTAYCWGNMNEVGYVTGAPVAAPSTAVSGNFTSLAAGLVDTCGDDANGIFCWGTNASGQLGDGSTNPSVVPVGASCAGASCSGTLQKIVGGDTHGCALYTDRHLTCWGDNSYGQLGDGTKTNRTQVTTTTMFSDWIDVAAGDVHTCGIRADGSLWCWGHGDGGQLGLGSVPFALDTPTRVGTSTSWASVVAGNHHTCGLQTDGSRWCWGENTFGSLGDGLAWVPGFVVVANDL